MKYFIVLLFIIVQACCAQTQEVSAWVTWKHNYKTIAGTKLDSNQVAFRLYKNQESKPDSFVFYTETQDTFFYLLGDPGLYTNFNSKWYCIAVRLDVPINNESASSDTVQGSFPILFPGSPYEFKTINMGVTK